jgi:hypothetical protein
MDTGTLGLTLVALCTVLVVPAVVGLSRGGRRGAGLVGACLVAAGIAAAWIVFWLALAQPHHVKHAVLFVSLALVALVAASFSRPVAGEAA